MKKLILVALRKESVDRNPGVALYRRRSGRSLSARRAWIEMAMVCQTGFDCRVALRKESVDRNVTSARLG